LKHDVNRKKIKRGPGKQWIEGKQFRLAQEIKSIQRRAAEYEARFVTVGPLVFFSPKLEMPGCWTPPTNLLHDSPEMETPSPSSSKKLTPTSQSAGRVTTTSKVAHSCYADRQAGRIITILGYPTAKIAQLG
jgi:hypothetical protein